MTYRRTFLGGGGLIFVVILISGLTFYFSIGPCPRGTFKCDNGSTCVPQRKICDEKWDCADKEDEHPVTCGMPYGGNRLAHDINDGVGKLPHRECNYFLEGCRRMCITVPVMFCDGQDLVTVPRIIHESANSTKEPIVRLHMPKNRLELTATTFVNYTLEYLDLSWNGIKEVPQKAFSGQGHLRKLILNGNNIEEIKPGSFSGLPLLEWLFLENNRLSELPDLQGIDHLRWLNFSNNRMRLDRGASFPRLNLWDLYLDNNHIESIEEGTFAELNQLEVLSLAGNRISHIHPLAFAGLRNLKDLRLGFNRLKVLPFQFLRSNGKLEVLYLNNNPEIDVQLSQYGSLTNITFLNLAGIAFERIDFEDINALPSLMYAVYHKFNYCSMTPRVVKCTPQSDGISSFANLIENRVLRYSAWMMALLTCFGNVLVLWVRCTGRDEKQTNKNVSTLIRNLAIADLFMGLYLLIISVQDERFRDNYHKSANDWVASWGCVVSGIVAMISSEVSLLILAFMSLDRFLVIADPFGAQSRFSYRKMTAPLFVIWLLGTMISVVPAIYYRSSSKFYGVYSGTCFPLHLEDLYPVGWEYSAFLFFGVNLVLLLMMVSLYAGLLYSIRKTSHATPLAFNDCEITIRFFFIVLTSVSCWASIISFKLLAIVGYEFGLDIYAFVVVYLLPLNSAVNPLLYTFTTPHYLQRIVTRHWREKLKCGHHRILTNTNGNCGSAGTRGTINYYSSNHHHEESHGKLVPSSSSNSGGSGEKGRSPDESQLEKGVVSSSPSSFLSANNKW